MLLNLIKKILLIGFLSLLNIPMEAQSLLWEITGENLQKPSYLYGTMHVRDKRVFNYNDSVSIAFNTSQAFAGELIIDKTMAKEVGKAALLPKDTTLKLLLGKKDYKKVKKVAKKKLGIMAGFINYIKPIYVAGYIAEASGVLKSDMKKTLDETFQDMARETNKKLIGIETIEEQMKALDKVSLKEQAKMLMDDLNNMDSAASISRDMVNKYLAQDIKSLSDMVLSEEIPDVFASEILLKRNYIMANRISVLLQEQSTFIGIGAAHLGGEEGVIELLRKKGFKLRPVDAPFKQ